MFKQSGSISPEPYSSYFELSTMDIVKMRIIMDFTQALAYENSDKAI